VWITLSNERHSANGLAVGPPIVHTAIGGSHPAFDWIKYDRFDSPNVRFVHDALHHGREALTTDAEAIQAGTVSVEAMNSAGYFLMQQKKYDDALAIFQRCLEIYPRSENAYNNLGDLYAATGKTELAKESYEKALAINPERDDTKAALAKLRATQP
jgi:tetratricopeptide (TPR) repeat protein